MPRTPARRVIPCLACAACALAILGCGPKVRNPKPIASDTPAQLPIIDGQPTFDMPITIRNSTTRLVPFRIEVPEEPGSTRDPFMQRFRLNFRAAAYSVPRISSAMPPETLHNALHVRTVRWHNVAFLQDDAPDRQTLLLSHRAVISQWAVLGDEIEDPTQSRPRWRIDALLFAVTETDTDEDGRLTAFDARRLYLTDPQGRNPVAVTPPEHNAHQWRYDPHRRTLTIEIQEDRTQDGTFLRAGRRTILATSVINPAPAEPLIDPQTAEQAARLLTEPRR